MIAQVGLKLLVRLPQLGNWTIDIETPSDEDKKSEIVWLPYARDT